MSNPVTDGIDWLKGLEGAGIVGFSSFLVGAGLQSLMSIAGVLPTISPYVAGLSTVFGVAYGFAKGANVA